MSTPPRQCLTKIQAANDSTLAERLAPTSAPTHSMMTCPSQCMPTFSSRRLLSYSLDMSSFAHEARVLINAASVVSASLAELQPEFLTCFTYENRTSSEQASRVAEFVMPTTDSASVLAQKLVSSAVDSDPVGLAIHETVNREGGWELVSDRLQVKLDEIERDHC